MVCVKCKAAGTANSTGDTAIAIGLHAECNDKGCVCQHKTGPGWFVRPGEKAPRMLTQSP